jgi:hypothetical protein
MEKCHDISNSIDFVSCMSIINLKTWLNITLFYFSEQYNPYSFEQMNTILLTKEMGHLRSYPVVEDPIGRGQTIAQTTSLPLVLVLIQLGKI